MEKPKCRVCGKSEWAHVCGEKDAGQSASASKSEDACSTIQPALKPGKPPKYDRNEAHRKYMREYMRRKRAAAKAEKDALQ